MPQNVEKRPMPRAWLELSVISRMTVLATLQAGRWDTGGGTGDQLGEQNKVRSLNSVVDGIPCVAVE